MRAGRATQAWSLLAVLVTLVGAVAAGLQERGAGGATVAGVLFFALPLSFALVGGLLGRRLPGHPVGRLCTAIGVLWALQGAGTSLAGWLAERGLLGAAGWAGLLTTLWLPAMGLTGTQLVLRLPTGRLPSAHWTWFARASAVVLAAATVVTVAEPGPVADVPGTRNPLGSTAVSLLEPLSLLVPVAVLGSVLSLVVRFRRATGTERLQIRWIALGGSALLVIVLVAFVPTGLGLVAEDSAPRFVEAVFAVAYSAVPVAIAVSVLRYRLYDIDVVLNRALVYGALTGLLAGTYVAAVLLLQVVLGGATGGSELTVVLSTLAVAALFGPARARLQERVDRRFYRRKYDAQRTLAGFVARLRQEVELDAVVRQVHGVVEDTVQPASVSIWLRPGGDRAGSSSTAGAQAAGDRP